VAAQSRADRQTLPGTDGAKAPGVAARRANQGVPGIRRTQRGPTTSGGGPRAAPGPQPQGTPFSPEAQGPHRFGPLSTTRQIRSFFSEPPAVSAVVAAVTEPALALGSLLAWAWALHGQIARADLVLALVVMALSFPARDRTGVPMAAVWAEVTAAWLARSGVIGLGLWATDSLAQVDARVLAGAWASTVVLTVLSTQAAGHLGSWWQGRPHRRRRAIVVGAGALAARVGQALRDQAGQGVDLIGCFDDRLDSRLDPGARGMRRGDLADVVDFIHRRGVQDVYITLPLGASEPAGSRIPRLLQALQDTTVSVHYVPDLLGITIIQGRLRDVNGVPVVGLCETPFTGINQFVKRVEDLVLASLIIMLISPLLLGVALGVKLSSPGPVLFRQRRNGLDGREIVVWKFRSMRTMDDGAVVRQATRGDPRITPFGAFIRRTSLDELPQFFNVLQGQMSIVGPRPHAVAHNDEYRELIRAYMVRHKVKPGITGWAQVNGHRGETDTLDKMRARVEYDLEYLHHWSLGLDLRIIARTVALVLGDRHAY
jgi:putative colanic acid biosynthesis UDP-glucose lipid carrier transferase